MPLPVVPVGGSVAAVAAGRTTTEGDSTVVFVAVSKLGVRHCCWSLLSNALSLLVVVVVVLLGSLPLLVIMPSVGAEAEGGMRSRRPMTKAGDEEVFELEVELQRELLAAAPPSMIIWGAAVAAAVVVVAGLLLAVDGVAAVAFVLLKDAFDWVFRIIILLR